MTTELLVKFADAIANARDWATATEGEGDRLDGFLEQLEQAGRIASDFVEEYECFPEFPCLAALVQKVDTASTQLWDLKKSDDPLFDAEARLDAITLPLSSDFEKARKQEREEELACDYDSEW